MLKNYSYSLYFIYILILNTSNISILFREQEQNSTFTCDIQSITKQCVHCHIYYAGHVFSVIFVWDALC